MTSTISPRFLDLFAGAGGSGHGVLNAFTRAGYTGVRGHFVNHCKNALETHAANHPGHRHYPEDVDTVTIVGKGNWCLLWASPECTSHSRAKGGTPASEQSRATGECVIKFARQLKPAHILVENVPEYVLWGPLIQKTDAHDVLQWVNDKRQPLPPSVPMLGIGESVAHWQNRLAQQGIFPWMVPDPNCEGESFEEWCGELRQLGYRLEWRVLQSCDYGDPTIRKRLFIQAVRGDSGLKIVWPNPTHGPGRLPYRTTADTIDWALPADSIFNRPKPLVDATLKRQALGLARYGVEGGCEQETTLLLPACPHGTDRFFAEIANPELKKRGTNLVLQPGGPPVSALPEDGQGQPPFLPYVHTLHSQGSGSSIRRPAPTVLTNQHAGLIQPWVYTYHSQGSVGADIKKPAPTSTAGGNHCALIQPWVYTYYSSGSVGSKLRGPAPTVRTHDGAGLCVPALAAGVLDLRFRMFHYRELARQMGFPDDYQWVGTKTQIVKAIGNSVSCRLSQALSTAVLTQNPNVPAI